MYQLPSNCQHPVNCPKHGQGPSSHQYHFHPQCIQIGPQRKIGVEPDRKRERLSKIIREQQKKIAEERRKKREEENVQLSLPNPIKTKPNSPLINPLVPALEENKRKEEDKDHARDYYPSSPIYVASHEEDAPALVDNLVPELAPEEKKDTDKKGDKTTEDRRDLIEITDEEGNLDSDLDYFS